ncbi:polysaccharide deacetylase family protein [Clostridium perfringens]|nr:polysaccharide deacetylase family protein [Clostridium perfringens]
MKKGIKFSLFFSVLICLGAFVGCKSLNEKQVEATESKEVVEANEFDDVKKADNEEKTNKLEYLSFEEDPNAEDAKVVSEYTNGLLKGTLQYPVRKDGKKVAYLTFDDGPSTTNTPEVLKILDKYNIKGTFFVTGNSISAGDKSKDLLKQIVKNGHAIGNHTYSHDYKYLYPSRKMNVNNIITDINKNNDLMKEVLGEDFSTRVVRFPGGYWSWQERTPMKEKMMEVGIQNIDWNALNGDAEGKKKNAAELVEFAKKSIDSLGPNADNVVILMHDTYGKEETVKALPSIIEYLQSKGFEFKSIK